MRLTIRNEDGSVSPANVDVKGQDILEKLAQYEDEEESQND